MTLATRLTALGYTLAAFARLTGVHYVTVVRWNTGVLATPHWVGVLLDAMERLHAARSGDTVGL